MFYDLRWERDGDQSSNPRSSPTPANKSILVAELDIKKALMKGLSEIPEDADRIWIKRNKNLATVKL